MKELDLSSQSDSLQSIHHEMTSNPSTQQSDVFVDNSPEAIEAQRLQELANSSQDSIQLQEWQDKIYHAEMQQENKTGIPDDLKVAVEQASGLSLSAIRVHYNSKKPAEVNAYAYADYPNIYIASGQEDYLEEELWHIVQQMRNQVKGNERINGKLVDSNPSREREAKNKRFKKTQKSRSPNQELQTKRGKGGIIQRAKIEKESHYGTFSIEKDAYKFIKEDSTGGKVLNFELEFMPNDDVDATKIGLTQVVKSRDDGKKSPLEPNQLDKMTANGSHVDQLPAYRNPLYATDDAPTENAEDLTAYKTSSGDHAIKENNEWKPAKMIDTPTTGGLISCIREFETAALVLEGGDKGEYYGSVKWGFQKVGGILSKFNFNLISKGVPSKNFLEAAKLWNNNPARGTAIVTKKTQVANLVGHSFENADGFKLNPGDRIEIRGTDEHSKSKRTNINYVPFKVLGSQKKYYNWDNIGYVNIKHIKDEQNGPNTLDLSLKETKLTKNENVSFYRNSNRTEQLDSLAKKTRLRVLGNDDDMLQVEVIATQEKGWVNITDLMDEFTP